MAKSRPNSSRKRCGFVRGSDHALASVRKRQGGQSQDLIEHSSAQADLAQFDIVQAGQHRDCQHQQAGLGLAAAASTAARNILPPPEACTVSMLDAQFERPRGRLRRRCWECRGI